MEASMNTTYLRPAARRISLVKESGLRDAQYMAILDLSMLWPTYQIDYSLVLFEEFVFCVYLWGD